MGWPKALLPILGVAVVFTLAVVAYFVVSTVLNPAGQIWRGAVVLFCWGVAGFFFWRHCQAQTRGSLRFDGEHWWYQPIAQADRVFEEQVVSVSCVADFDEHLWLRLQWTLGPNFQPGTRFFAWAARPSGRDHAPWLALRRAVFFDAAAHTRQHQVTA